MVQTLGTLFFLFKILFIYLSERERERERERESTSRGNGRLKEGSPLNKEPDAGLNPNTLGP